MVRQWAKEQLPNEWGEGNTNLWKWLVIYHNESHDLRYRLFLEIFLKVFGTPSAGIKLGQGRHEMCHFFLLFRRGMFGIPCSLMFCFRDNERQRHRMTRMILVVRVSWVKENAIRSQKCVFRHLPWNEAISKMTVLVRYSAVDTAPYWRMMMRRRHVSFSWLAFLPWTMAKLS